MKLHLKTSVRGEFTIQIKTAGGIVRYEETFKNLVTNLGLDTLMNGNNFFDYVHVGSGTTPPSPSDVSLASFVARVNNDGTVSQGNTGSPNYEHFQTYTYQFAQGAAAGNLTEVGVGDYATNTLHTRALFLDGNGNPTTITVLSDEYLTITYTIYLHPNLSDVTGTVGGYSFIIRPCRVGTTNSPPSGWLAIPVYIISQSGTSLNTGTIGAITSAPSGTGMTVSSVSNSAYVSGTFTRTASLVWTPAAGAINANSLVFRTAGQVYQVGFTPSINKTSSQRLAITLQYSVARYP